MNKLKLLLTCLIPGIMASGQINQVNITNFSVKNNLPAAVDTWNSVPGVIVLSAQKVPSARLKDPMILLQIKNGNSIVCGNSTASLKRLESFDVRSFNISDLLPILGNCAALKPGNYTLCARFFNIDKVAISREVCGEFRVDESRADNQAVLPIYIDNGSGKQFASNVTGESDCSDRNFMLNAPYPSQIITTTGSISYTQPFSVVTTPPKTIKSIKADLVYFEMIPENDDCVPCNKDDRLYGHFANGTNSQQWTGAQSNLSIDISTPVTPCCSTMFRWCIRYRVEFTDCIVCTRVICYEMGKDGCLIESSKKPGLENPTTKSN